MRTSDGLGVGRGGEVPGNPGPPAPGTGNMGAFFKRDMVTGDVADSIQLPEDSPFPHGMSVWNGYIYWTDDIGGGLAPVCRVKI